MTMTIEQKAIREFLAKPVSYGGACACMGPREIPGFELKNDEYIVKMLNESQKASYIIFVKNYFNISMEEAKIKVNENKVIFNYEYGYEHFAKKAKEKEIKVEVEIINHPTGLEPFCPCAMYNVVQIEDNYFEHSPA